MFGSSTYFWGSRRWLSSGGYLLVVALTAACGHIGLDLSEGAFADEGTGGGNTKKDDKAAGGIGADAGGTTQSAGGSVNGAGGWLAGGRSGQCREGQSDGDGDCVPSGGCQGDELQGPTGDCYFFIKELLSYEVAGERCASRGADWTLAAVRSEEENEFILSHLQEESWIGGGSESEDGSYRWSRGDEVFWEGGNEGQAPGDRFSYWSEGQPSDEIAGELCMIYRRDGDSFAWALTRCDDAAGVVCQGLPET